HAELVIAGLRAGKHVFVEKPLCINPAELAAIESCIEELGDHCPVLMVGFNRRFAPALSILQRHFAQTGPLSVSYRFATAQLPANSWTQDEDIGGGRIIGEACHAIDTCAALIGSPATRVYAESLAKVHGIETTDDRVFITLRHTDGSVSNISYQAGGDRAAAGERIEVYGGGHTGILDNWETIELWRDNSRTRERGGKDKGHAAELEKFLTICRNGGDWPISWEHIYGTSWASLAAVQSLREGLPIEYLPGQRWQYAIA
ncbi:MAG: Gfo/Idh/MocA family oxidoreductase, partial [Acidobacteriota bacterium]